jgi:hypothetical protein
MKKPTAEAPKYRNTLSHGRSFLSPVSNFQFPILERGWSISGQLSARRLPGARFLQNLLHLCRLSQLL